MVRVLRLMGILACVSLCAATSVGADVVTDWKAITISTIGAGAPVQAPAV